MAQMPIEVIELGNVSPELIKQAISLANSLQTEFVYLSVPESDARFLRVSAYNYAKAADFLNEMERFKIRICGYHPFLIAFVDSKLDGTTLSNLFGSCRGSKGVGVATIAGVPDVIIPSDRMLSYFLYYLARYTYSFVAPEHRTHSDTRECVFDLKDNKCDLRKSMKARALCDHCRKTLVSGEVPVSPEHLIALDRIFAESGRLLERNNDQREDERKRPRVFIGSSTEGLQIANKLQELLRDDVAGEVWNQGTVFGLGGATLEELEQAVHQYDFGIFVFTPDDQISSRGESKPVARDNVIFELGLFIGKLTRRRSFVIHPSKKAIALPSDLSGITTASYDPENSILASSLGPVCQKIREAIERANSFMRV
jgi:predicted nucleotide-binding protein